MRTVMSLTDLCTLTAHNRDDACWQARRSAGRLLTPRLAAASEVLIAPEAHHDVSGEVVLAIFPHHRVGCLARSHIDMFAAAAGLKSLYCREVGL